MRVLPKGYFAYMVDILAIDVSVILFHFCFE